MGSFFLKFIYFNWKIITLQYCNSFRHTSVWIGHRCAWVPSILKSLPPPSPPHPFRLLQSTGFGCAASSMELILAIYLTYGIGHASTLFSQIIPLSASQWEASVAFLKNKIHLYIYGYESCIWISIFYNWQNCERAQRQRKVEQPHSIRKLRIVEHLYND